MNTSTASCSGQPGAQHQLFSACRRAGVAGICPPEAEEFRHNPPMPRCCLVVKHLADIRMTWRALSWRMRT